MQSQIQRNFLGRISGRVRRNHALEHATLQVIGKKTGNLNLAGYSDLSGFWLIGKVSTQLLQEAVDEALKRLRQGESWLAVHPNCGTNYASVGLLAGLVAWLGMLGSRGNWRARLERLPWVVTLVTAVLVFSQPLGPYLQEHVTTNARIGNLEVYEIMCFQRGDVPIHHIKTRN